jgi:tRNA threonylcarbamoyladenosine biosynthesis protein TsaE
MSQAHWTHHVADLAGTDRLAQALAAELTEGMVVALNGPLGAGKTRLVQGIAAATGVDPRDVVSPTFVLMHEYQARQPIYHLDAYRIHDEDEFLQLGVEEHFVAPNLVFVEWADRVPDCLPEDRLEITIAADPGEGRHFEIAGRGPRAAEIVRRVASRLNDNASA